MLKRIIHACVLLGLSSLAAAASEPAEETRDCLPPAAASETETPAQPVQPCYENDELSVRVVMRTSEQLTAFYLGREFSQAAIDKILDTCFVTPIVHNKTLDVLWLELDEWQFNQGDRVIPGLQRH